MQQKMDELSKQPAPAPQTIAPPVAANPSAGPQTVQKSAPPPVMSEADSKARQDAELQAEAAAKKRKKQESFKVSNKFNFPALSGPDSGISAEKQQQLDQLLKKYKNDEITPEQYHAERAKVLGL